MNDQVNEQDVNEAGQNASQDPATATTGDGAAEPQQSSETEATTENPVTELEEITESSEDDSEQDPEEAAEAAVPEGQVRITVTGASQNPVVIGVNGRHLGDFYLDTPYTVSQEEARRLCAALDDCEGVTYSAAGLVDPEEEE